MPSFDELYSPTRRTVIALLRRSERTIPELAEALEVSSNAVRSHMSSLEADGVVRPAGVRRDGVGKPARLYRLTSEAEERLSRAYAPVLALLVEVLEERLGGEETRDTLREVGRRIGRSAHRAGSARERAARARETLEELGGAVDVRESGNGVVLEGLGCPLGTVVHGSPDACVLAAALIGEILEAPVRANCDRSGERPRCRFETELEPTP